MDSDILKVAEKRFKHWKFVWRLNDCDSYISDHSRSCEFDHNFSDEGSRVAKEAQEGDCVETSRSVVLDRHQDCDKEKIQGS